MNMYFSIFYRCQSVDTRVCQVIDPNDMRIASAFDVIIQVENVNEAMCMCRDLVSPISGTFLPSSIRPFIKL